MLDEYIGFKIDKKNLLQWWEVDKLQWNGQGGINREARIRWDEV